MSDFQNEMNRTVQSFVTQISELARRAALDTLESAFGGKGAGRSTTGASALVSTKAAELPRGKRGSKRTSADIEALSEQAISFIKASPGLRIEQINKELVTTTKDLALPLRKLVADGVVNTKGQKRSTTYFPGKKAK